MCQRRNRKLSVKRKLSDENGDGEYNEEERGEEYCKVKHCAFRVQMVLAES